MRFLLSCLLMSVLCAGCVLRSGQKSDSLDGLGNSYEMRELAESTAMEIQRRYSPAQTTLVLHRAPGYFGERLELALRSRGFAVVPPGTPGTEVSYTADVLEDGVPPMGYVQVRLPEGQFFSFSRELEVPLWPTVNPEPVPAVPALAENILPPASPVDSPASSPAPANPLVSPPAPVESAPRVMPAALAPSGVSSAAELPPHKVRVSATAAQVAKRNKVPVADFCRWNDVLSDETLHAGRRVYLATPPGQRNAAPIPVAAEVKPVASIAPASTAPTPVAAPEPAPVHAEPPTLQPQQDAVAAIPEPSVVAPLPVESIHAPESVIAEIWNIQPGGLRVQIHGWAARAGYQLVWKAQNDFDMEASANFEGEFLKAVETLFAGMQRSGYALRVTVYQGNKVLEVTEG